MILEPVVKHLLLARALTFFLFNEYMKHKLAKTFDNSNNIKSRERRRHMHKATVTYIGQCYQYFTEITKPT